VVLSQSAHASREYLSTLELLSCPASTSLAAFKKKPDLPCRGSLWNAQYHQIKTRGGGRIKMQFRTRGNIPPTPPQSCRVRSRSVMRRHRHSPNFTHRALVAISSCARIFLALPVQPVGLPINVLGHLRQHIGGRNTPAKKEGGGGGQHISTSCRRCA
jgi:hypothetical protein